MASGGPQGSTKHRPSVSAPPHFLSTGAGPPASAGGGGPFLPGASDRLLTETSRPSGRLLPASSAEWLPGAPLRSSRNQLPVSHLIKLLSRCLHLRLRKQEEGERLGVCPSNEVGWDHNKYCFVLTEQVAMGDGDLLSETMSTGEGGTQTDWALGGK